MILSETYHAAIKNDGFFSMKKAVFELESQSKFSNLITAEFSNKGRFLAKWHCVMFIMSL
jgi:hypothetical protein